MQAVPPGPLPGPLRPGQRPTPAQIQAMQQQIAIDAQKAGMTVPQFLEALKNMKQQQMQQQMQQMQQQQQQQAGQAQGQGQGQQQQPRPPQQRMPVPGQPQPITPGPPNPIALALASFLRSQDLKPRTSILNGDRKDMFRVKRALRALQSPAYEKARKKNPALPAITDRASLENTFKLLPMSMLALRVVKVDPNAGHEGHGHAHGDKKGPKRVKGLWTVKIEPQQEAQDDMYYVWLWEGPQTKRKVYAALALLLIFAIVLYPLWPLRMRQGVYYLSWAFIGFLCLFFAMAIFRVILFVVTYFALSPGFWLFPNLWEDVSVADSFKPIWAWHDPNPPKKKKKKSGSKSAGSASAASAFSAHTGQPAPAEATTTATSTQVMTDAQPHQRSYVAPKVEEAGEDED